MPQCSATRVYTVPGRDKDDARHNLDAWLATGLDALFDGQLQFESIRLALEESGPASGWWEIVRDQLLGPKPGTQQPAWKKSRS